MKHTSKQSSRSRNKALAQRAAQLGCGISLIAVSAMLAARPARAGGADPASVVLAGVPANSSSAGFVTSGSQQINIAAQISSALNDATGSNSVDNNGVISVPSTTSVTGNELAAFATGSSQTNTVDLANIGTADGITGISVLAEQLNTFSSTEQIGYIDEEPYDAGTIYVPGNINSSVDDSELLDQTTNAVNGDLLNNSGNLIEAQVTGNVADSSVNGVVPLDYASAEPGTFSLGFGGGTASGNIVVGSSQLNDAIDAGDDGSSAGLYEDDILLDVNSTGEYPQSLSLSTAESDNALSAVFLGNSANNDIGVNLPSGAGATAFAGALVVANQQANTRGTYGIFPYDEDNINFEGNWASTGNSDIGTNIEGTVTPTITLTDGSVTEDGNIISAAATGNSAVGAAGAPGNEISLGINLNGATPAYDAGNTINAEGTLISGGDLVLGNQQYQGGSRVGAYTNGNSVYVNVQNLAGSSIDLSNNAITASALANNASNTIETASGAGINLIKGLTALTSEQTDPSGAYAQNSYGGINANAGYGGGTLSLTNASATLADDKITTTADGNQVTNNVALSASTIDAGAIGAATGPATVDGGLPGGEVADAGISLVNAQSSPAPAVAAQYSIGIGAYLQGETISNSSVIVTNPLFTSEATANTATNSIMADGSQGVSGSMGLLNTQVQSGGASAYLEEGYEDDYGNGAVIALQSVGGTQGISGSTALLSGTELYAEATDNNASNTLDAMGGTLSNAAGAAGTLGLAAKLGTPNEVSAQAVSDLALVNEQDAFNNQAYADNYNSFAYITADSTNGTVSDDSFTVSGPANNAPTAQALAIGNAAVNALSALASTVLMDTAGLVNAQSNTIGAEALLQDSFVGVDINVPYETSYEFDSGDDGRNISDTSITVGTGAAGGSNPNILRALAYGNQASNVLSVSAGLVNPDATATSFAADGSVIPDGAPFDTNLTGDTVYAVGAAYGLLSDQSAAGTIAAEVTPTEIGVYLGNTEYDPTVTDVTSSVDGNALVASAFGNEASNTATVAATNLVADGYYPAADVTNLQTNESTLSASLAGFGDSSNPTLANLVYGTGEVLASALGITNNTLLTQAEGNDATNSLDTTGNNITDSSEVLQGVGSAVEDEAPSTDPLAFSVQNDQYGGLPITVNQDGANALISTGGAVDVSALTADSNAFEATGYGNNATNSLDFGGTSNPVNTLDTSSGLQNVQYMEGDMNVTLGSPGTAAVAAGQDVDIPAVEYTVQYGNSYGQLTDGGNVLQVSGEPLTFHVSGLTGTELTDFENLFDGDTYYDPGTKTFTLAVGSHDVSDTNLFSQGDGYLYFESGSAQTGQYTATDTIPGTPAVAAVPPSPSVLITVAGDITGSTLDVSNNAFDATAIANNAVNTQNIAATSVMDGGDLLGPPGGYVGFDYYDASAYGGYLLTNLQSTQNSVTANAYGEAGINPTNDSSITSSTLLASNNTQVVKAEADVASNTLTLAATDTTGTDPVNSAVLALVSDQSSGSDVTAEGGTIDNGIGYGLIVTAPGAITDSALIMDDNSSEALAVENNVTNLLSANATTLADATDFEGANATMIIGGNDTVNGSGSADYSVTNVQTVYDDSVSAFDSTDVTNSDSTSVSTSGIVDSTASLSGNSTAAYAEANAASNTLNMTSTNSAASGVVSNGQSNEAEVEAEGGGIVAFALNGRFEPDPAAATGSAINVSNNSTVVQGIGNQASNALNADTGATYGPQIQAVTENGGTQASATYAVLNVQQNTGPVSASGGAEYSSELNGGVNVLSPVSNTTVTVSYNTVDIKAFGNTATNSATVSALNSGNATVALENTQTNTAAITATGDNSQIGSTIGGPGASNVTVEVGNNSVIASAVGNVATNAIAHQ